MTVSLDHEGLALLVRNRPSLAAKLLAQVFGMPLPASTGCAPTKTSSTCR